MTDRITDERLDELLRMMECHRELTDIPRSGQFYGDLISAFTELRQAREEVERLHESNKALSERICELRAEPEGYPGIAHDLETMRAENARLEAAWDSAFAQATRNGAEAGRLRSALAALDDWLARCDHQPNHPWRAHINRALRMPTPVEGNGGTEGRACPETTRTETNAEILARITPKEKPWIPASEQYVVPPASEAPPATRLLDEAIAAMAALHASFTSGDDPEITPQTTPVAYREFVDTHARLMYERAQLRKEDPPATDEGAPRRGESLRAMMRQRDEAWARIEKLQCALAFWLPGVPAEEHDLHERVADDAFLLAPYDGPAEPSAEDLGWITLSSVAAGEAPPATAPEPTLATGCQRSHPHEEMSPECERLTEVARAEAEAPNEGICCETHGHLWGLLGTCVMCRQPRPSEPMRTPQGTAQSEPRCTCPGGKLGRNDLCPVHGKPRDAGA